MNLTVILNFIKTYPKVFLIGAVLVCASIGTATVYYKGYFSGKEQVQNEQMVKSVEIRAIQNEIRNNRPDDAALYDSLQHGTF